MEDEWVEGSPFCLAYADLYRLSSLKNHPIYDFLVWGAGRLVSFSFRFCHHLSNRETTETTYLLSLLDGCDFRKGRRDVRVWKPNPSKGCWKEKEKHKAHVENPSIGRKKNQGEYLKGNVVFGSLLEAIIHGSTSLWLGMEFRVFNLVFRCNCFALELYWVLDLLLSKVVFS